jgi:hypothetical protein
MALCRMFKRAIRDAGFPKYLSSDHDPLCDFNNGRRTCEFWTSAKSKLSHTSRNRIRSLSG